MRKTFLMIAASLIALFAVPLAVNAKSYHGDAGASSKSSASSSRKSAKRKYSKRKSANSAGRKYRNKASRKMSRKYAKKSRRSGKRYSKRKSRGRKYSSGGTSTSCLTSSARNLLARIRSKFGNVQIISTCRPGARIATTGRPSKHASGQAIDFRVPGRKAAVVSWLKANHRNGGIMTYSDMDHVHVDIGARFVALGRNSGKS